MKGALGLIAVTVILYVFWMSISLWLKLTKRVKRKDKKDVSDN